MRLLAFASLLLVACGGTLRNEAPPPLAPQPVTPAFSSFWSSALRTTTSASASMRPTGEVAVSGAVTRTTTFLVGPSRRIAFGAIEGGELGGVYAHRMQFLLLPTEVVDAALVEAGLCVLRTDSKVRCAPLDRSRQPMDIAVDPAATRLFSIDADRLCVMRAGGDWACYRESHSKWDEDKYGAADLAKFGVAESTVPDSRCFLTRDHKLVCFEGASSDLRGPRVVAEGVVQASVGAGQGDFGAGCAAKVDGAVVCWGGMNETGTSGDGKRGPHDGPWLAKGVGDAVSVARAADHACALTRGHRVMCWGAADGWSMGDAALASATTYRTCHEGESPGAGDCVTEPSFGEPHNHLHLVPVRVPELDGVVSIAAGYETTCGVRTDGRVLCVGGGHPGPWTIGVGEK
jgi:hypothetical protein